MKNWQWFTAGYDFCCKTGKNEWTWILLQSWDFCGALVWALKILMLYSMVLVIEGIDMWSIVNGGQALMIGHIDK